MSQISNPEPISGERLESISRLFVYGILKRGFPLDLKQYGGTFVSKAHLAGAQLYHIGGGVGLRKVDDDHTIAHGELWEIPNTLWRWLDDIEQNGFCYTREKMVVMTQPKNEENGQVSLVLSNAWVYVHTYPDMAYENPVEENDWHE